MSKFGIEIEFKSKLNEAEIQATLEYYGIEVVYNENPRAKHACWFLTLDGSVDDGFELVSPPLEMDDDSYSQIETACSALQSIGAYIDEQCGLHVHHDAHDLDEKQIINVFVQYAQDDLSAHLPSDRINSEFAPALTTYHSIETIKACQDLDDLNTLFPHRYSAVNLQSFYRHETIEFRQHGGTLDSAIIIDWVNKTSQYI